MVFKSMKKKPDASRVSMALRPAPRLPRTKKQTWVNARGVEREDCWQKCVLHDGKTLKLDGVMIDISSKGARIRFRSHATLPREVVLLVPALALKRHARTVWQRRGDAGFIFL